MMIFSARGVYSWQNDRAVNCRSANQERNGMSWQEKIPANAGITSRNRSSAQKGYVPSCASLGDDAHILRAVLTTTPQMRCRPGAESGKNEPYRNGSSFSHSMLDKKMVRPSKDDQRQLDNFHASLLAIIKSREWRPRAQGLTEFF
jgi:hypothetical protein